MTECPELPAAGGVGKGGMHLTTRTVKSSMANPIAITKSQAFNSLAIRSTRIRCYFIGDLVLLPLDGANMRC
jgi:hypothetical protein